MQYPHLVLLQLGKGHKGQQGMHGQLTRWREWSDCDVGEATEGFENELWCRWSNGRAGEWVTMQVKFQNSGEWAVTSVKQWKGVANPSVTSPKSGQLILQSFRHFTYVTAHSPTLLLLHLHHSSFSNPSVASPTSQLILQPFHRFTYVTGSSLTSSGNPPMLFIIITVELWVKDGVWGRMNQWESRIVRKRQGKQYDKKCYVLTVC